MLTSLKDLVGMIRLHMDDTITLIDELRCRTEEAEEENQRLKLECVCVTCGQELKK